MANNKKSGIKSALWSVALPGLGQLINKKYIKGIIFIILEFVINVKSNLNSVIILSFYGKIEEAINQADYQWLLFYPCVYLFAIWDAYSDGVEEEKKYAYVPFVLAAYITTVATIYSKTFRLNGVLIGPIFLPIISIILVLTIGFAIRKLIIEYTSK